MPVPASKVKALCSSTEAELVRKSRPPQIKSLSLAEVKQAKARARKLADKWQGQTYKQSRAQKSTKGAANTDTNTQLKAEIFRDALGAFEARQAELEAKGAKPAAKKKATAAKSPGKKAKAASHRGTRAAIRDELALVTGVLNRGAQAVKNTVLSAAASLAHRGSTEEGAPASAAEAKAADKKPKPTKKVTKKAPPAKAGLAKPSKAKQVRATTKAKQARLAESGKTSRVVGHVSARGKRKQARRDSGGKK